MLHPHPSINYIMSSMEDTETESGTQQGLNTGQQQRLNQSTLDLAQLSQALLSSSISVERDFL